MTDPREVEALLALEQKATRGPWKVQDGDDETADEIFVWDEQSRIEDYPSYTTIAEELLGVDSQLIAQSRNLLPQLLREWLQMRAALGWIGDVASLREYAPDDCLDQIDRKVDEALGMEGDEE